MQIEVADLPAPQGSKRHVGGGRMIESSRKVGPWREAVRAEVQRAMQGQEPWDRPVHVIISFYLARPKSAPKRVLYPAKTPDLDKLVRSTLDGLVAGGALRDDGLVVMLTAEKQFGAPGCEIEIEALQ